jgi:2-hydroxy-3-oxopropionate reductase
MSMMIPSGQSDFQAAPASGATGVIGLGNMGLPMTLNLLKAGTGGPAPRRAGAAGNGEVRVTGRSRARAAGALEAGAIWAATPAELAGACSVVILMVPDLPQVDELLFGPAGIAEAPTDVIVVVCSTVSPTGIRQLDARLRERTGDRMRIVDAPVSGGTEGAEAGTLSIMIGGSEGDVAKVLPILSPCGVPVYLGPLGAGEVAKACNQLIVAATMTAIAEASVIAERSGLDLDTLLTLLQGGYAGSRVLETKRQRLVDKDYSPTGVARFMSKDLAFAAAAASATGTTAPTLEGLRRTFAALVKAGHGDEDLAVIQRYIAEL